MNFSYLKISSNLLNIMQHHASFNMYYVHRHQPKECRDKEFTQGHIKNGWRYIDKKVWYYGCDSQEEQIEDQIVFLLFELRLKLDESLIEVLLHKVSAEEPREGITKWCTRGCTETNH